MIEYLATFGMVLELWEVDHRSLWFSTAMAFINIQLHKYQNPTTMTDLTNFSSKTKVLSYPLDLTGFLP